MGDKESGGITEIDPHISKKYEIRRRIGKGAYGIVWKAIERRTGEVLAVKKIFDAFRNETDAQRTFREIVFLLEFSCHPNVIRLLNVLKADNNKDIYLVFQFMETDLHNVIKKGNVLEDIHRRYIMYQLFRATRYLHSGSVIHRDLKPSNVLVDSDCRVKVADFGLARSVEPSALIEPQGDPTLTNYVATRWYRAPEILLNSKRYTLGVDMWSLGCILGEMLLGKPMFPGSSTIDQIERIMAVIAQPVKEDLHCISSQYAASILAKPHGGRTPRTLRDVLAGSPNDAIDLVEKLLVFNPDKRLTAAQTLKHPYVARFHNAANEPALDHPVVPCIRDDVQLSVEIYRNKLYELIASRKSLRTKNILTNSHSDNVENSRNCKEKIISSSSNPTNGVTRSTISSQAKSNESRSVLTATQAIKVKVVSRRPERQSLPDLGGVEGNTRQSSKDSDKSSAKSSGKSSAKSSSSSSPASNSRNKSSSPVVNKVNNTLTPEKRRERIYGHTDNQSSNLHHRRSLDGLNGVLKNGVAVARSGGVTVTVAGNNMEEKRLSLEDKKGPFTRSVSLTFPAAGDQAPSPTKVIATYNKQVSQTPHADYSSSGCSSGGSSSSSSSSGSQHEHVTSTFYKQHLSQAFCAGTSSPPNGRSPMLSSKHGSSSSAGSSPSRLSPNHGSKPVYSNSPNRTSCSNPTPQSFSNSSSPSRQQQQHGNSYSPAAQAISSSISRVINGHSPPTGAGHTSNNPSNVVHAYNSQNYSKVVNSSAGSYQNLHNASSSSSPHKNLHSNNSSPLKNLTNSSSSPHKNLHSTSNSAQRTLLNSSNSPYKNNLVNSSSSPHNSSINSSSSPQKTLLNSSNSSHKNLVNSSSSPQRQYSSSSFNKHIISGSPVKHLITAHNFDDHLISRNNHFKHPNSNERQPSLQKISPVKKSSPSLSPIDGVANGSKSSSSDSGYRSSVGLKSSPAKYSGSSTFTSKNFFTSYSPHPTISSSAYRELRQGVK